MLSETDSGGYDESSLLNGFSVLVGLWVAVAAALLFELSANQFVSDLAVAATVVVGASAAAYRGVDETDRVATVGSVVAAVAGLWLLLSPVVFETAGLKLASDFFGGLLVAGTDGYVAWGRMSTESAVRTGGHPADRGGTAG
ncbi:MAG: hypothetical protein ABEJ43_11270 [Haloferacaceae archaeon]